MAAGAAVSTGTVPEPLPDGVSSSSEVSLDELQLAHRNHGMHLEALRYDVTPAGMHYLLIHFDVPEADEGSWTLSIEGSVRDPLQLSIADVKARLQRTNPVDQATEYNRMFGELVALEQHRRTLRELSMGTAS